MTEAKESGQESPKRKPPKIKLTRAEIAAKRKRSDEMWAYIRSMYESVGLIMDDQALLDLVQKLLKIDMVDMPTVNTMRVRVNRNKWIAGGDKKDFLDDYNESDFYSTDARKQQVKKGFELILCENVANMSDGQDDDTETEEQIKDRQNKAVEEFVKRVKQMRLDVRDSHMSDIENLRRYQKEAVEFMMCPIDLTATEKEMALSMLKQEWGRKRHIDFERILNSTVLLHTHEAGILGIEYEVGAGGDARQDQAKALNEIRQKAKRAFDDQQKRYDNDRVFTEGRGERIAETLNKAADATAGEIPNEWLDEIDSESNENPTTNDENLSNQDDERDFTETLQDGGD